MRGVLSSRRGPIVLRGACAPLKRELVLATRGSRLAAHLIDGLVVVLAMGLALGLFSAGGTRNLEVIALLAAVAGLLTVTAAQMWAQVTWGQSFGKRLMKIKVVRTNGADIELWRLILLRNIVMQVSAQLCGFVGLVDTLLIFGAQQRCLHDYLADSMVVQFNRDSSPPARLG